VAALAGALVLAVGAGGAAPAALRVRGAVEEGDEERREDARADGSLEVHEVPGSERCVEEREGRARRL